MRVFNYVKILFCFIYIEYSWDKYPQKINNFDVKVSWKDKNIFTTGYFLCRKMSVFRCRSLPIPINQFKKYRLVEGIKVNRPKRKKSKDNSYTLLVINNKYYVEFKDVKNILNTVEVTEEQFEDFNEFELEDKSQMNKDERHKEKLEVHEETLYKRANLMYGSVEDDFIKNLGMKI